MGGRGEGEGNRGNRIRYGGQTGEKSCFLLCTQTFRFLTSSISTKPHCPGDYITPRRTLFCDSQEFLDVYSFFSV